MTIDGRKLSHQTCERIRRMAVAHVRAGQRPSSVIRSYGMCRTTIYRWLRMAKKRGERGLRSRKGTGRPSTLSTTQKRQVRRWICGKDPRRYGFEAALWTRQIVAELIFEQFAKKLSLPSVGRLLKELQITPQKPLRRAYERDEQAIDSWIKEDYPKLKKRAKKLGASMFFLDETGIRSDDALGRTWGPRGDKTIVKTSGKRQSINAISAVNAKGAFWYNVYAGHLNAVRFIQFLKTFLRGRNSRVFLTLDGHSSHTAKKVKEYVKSLKRRLELHFLPPYAPDLNPDEFVWNYLKQQGVTKKPLREKESLRNRVEQDLASIKTKPKLVRSFFEAPSVAYIMN